MSRKKAGIIVAGVPSLKRLLKLRQKEVGIIRNRLRKDTEELESLLGCCERAYAHIDDAINALSELA